MKIKTFTERFAICTLVLCAGIVAVMWGCNYRVVKNAQGKTFDHVSQVPNCDAGVLLGTTPQTRIGGRRNYFFKYRIDAAESLYKAGKIKYLLISGDANSLDGINEVECMRDSLLKRGVPESAIVLDGMGLRTLDSVVRAAKIYGIHNFVVISQRFHNERAIYLAKHRAQGIETVTGFNAKSPTSAISMMTYVREYFARVKVFIDIAMHKEPISMERY